MKKFLAIGMVALTVCGCNAADPSHTEAPQTSTEEVAEMSTEETEGAEDVTDTETESPTEEQTEDGDTPEKVLPQETYDAFMEVLGEDLSDLFLEAGGYATSCTVYLEKLTAGEAANNEYGIGRFALEAVTPEGVIYCMDFYEYNPALWEGNWGGFWIHQAVYALEPLGAPAVSEDVWAADTEFQTFREQADMIKTFTILSDVERAERLDQEVEWEGKTMFLDATLYYMEDGSVQVTGATIPQTEDFLNVTGVSEDGTQLYVDYVYMTTEQEAVPLVFDTASGTLGMAV